MTALLTSQNISLQWKRFKLRTTKCKFQVVVNFWPIRIENALRHIVNWQGFKNEGQLVQQVVNKGEMPLLCRHLVANKGRFVGNCSWEANYSPTIQVDLRGNVLERPFILQPSWEICGELFFRRHLVTNQKLRKQNNFYSSIQNIETILGHWTSLFHGDTILKHANNSRCFRELFVFWIVLYVNELDSFD